MRSSTGLSSGRFPLDPAPFKGTWPGAERSRCRRSSDRIVHLATAGPEKGFSRAWTTDIYEKIGRALKLPSGELSNLADLQRKEELRKRVAEPPRPLFKECRELILRKCDSARQKEVRRIFEKEPFGELERLVTQKLLDVAQGVAKEELQNEEWLRLMAQLSGRSYEQVRVSILEFLDTDVFNVSVENCISFLDPIIDSWDIDLKTFGMEVVPNRRLTAGSLKRFEFAEQEPPQPVAIEPGLEQFLKDASLSGGATEEEIVFLKGLKLRGKRPSPISLVSGKVLCMIS